MHLIEFNNNLPAFIFNGSNAQSIFVFAFRIYRNIRINQIISTKCHRFGGRNSVAFSYTTPFFGFGNACRHTYQLINDFIRR